MANPVAKLNEWTQCKVMGPPYYEFERTAGDDHAPTFKCTAYAGGYQRSGTGSNKKAAKQKAAEAVLDAIAQQSGIATVAEPVAEPHLMASQQAGTGKSVLHLDVENRPKELSKALDIYGYHCHVYASSKYPALASVREACKAKRAVLHVVDSGVKSAADVDLIRVVSQMLVENPELEHTIVSIDSIFYAFIDCTKGWPVQLRSTVV